jgi:hypothetical protein
MAETFTNLQARERILRVARHFERMAQEAHQRDLDARTSSSRRGRAALIEDEPRRRVLRLGVGVLALGLWLPL